MTYGEQYTLVPGPGIVPSWTGSYTHEGQIRQVIHSEDQVYSVNIAQGKFIRLHSITFFCLMKYFPKTKILILDYKGIKTSSSPPPETSQPNSNPPSLNIGIKSESPGEQAEHKNFNVAVASADPIHGTISVRTSENSGPFTPTTPSMMSQRSMDDSLDNDDSPRVSVIKIIITKLI